MPAGLLVTVPFPVPPLVTVKVYELATTLKVAVTDLAAFIVTVHVPVPVQAPLQPAKVEPDAAVAVSVTEVPLEKLAVQVPGQLIPAGLLVTVPLPVPAVVTDNANVVVLGIKRSSVSRAKSVHTPEQAVRFNVMEVMCAAVLSRMPM
jgi:hypothetical protein